MMKVKISDLLNSTEALQKLAKTELKAKLAWQVGRILRAADEEIKNFNEARLTLIRKYGEKDENGELITDDGGNCKILPDQITTFQEELNELIAADIDINANKILIDDLNSIDFTPAEMTQLEMFIDFDD